MERELYIWFWVWAFGWCSRLSRGVKACAMVACLSHVFPFGSLFDVCGCPDGVEVSSVVVCFWVWASGLRLQLTSMTDSYKHQYNHMLVLTFF